MAEVVIGAAGIVGGVHINERWDNAPNVLSEGAGRLPRRWEAHPMICLVVV